MGSYLSIVNDSSDRWQCRIGPDEAALKIAGIIVTVIGAIATVIGTMGSAAPIVASLASSGAVGILGVSSGALASITAGAAAAAKYASVIGTVSKFTLKVAKGIAEKLDTDGYHWIEVGDKHRWGKMTLSLWQQGTCVKTTNVDQRKVRTETLYMRPIFSGSSNKSNRDHKIQWWINKWGTEGKDIVAEESRRELTETDTDIVIFYANGTNTYTGDE